MEVVAALSLAHSSNTVVRSPFAKVFSHPFCVSPQQDIVIQFCVSYCGQCARFMGLGEILLSLSYAWPTNPKLNFVLSDYLLT